MPATRPAGTTRAVGVALRVLTAALLLGALTLLAGVAGQGVVAARGLAAPAPVRAAADLTGPGTATPTAGDAHAEWRSGAPLRQAAAVLDQVATEPGPAPGQSGPGGIPPGDATMPRLAQALLPEQRDPRQRTQTPAGPGAAAPAARRPSLHELTMRRGHLAYKIESLALLPGTRTAEQEAFLDELHRQYDTVHDQITARERESETSPIRWLLSVLESLLSSGRTAVPEPPRLGPSEPVDLRTAVGDARAVFVGDDHFSTQDKAAFKSTLQALEDLGFRALGMEMLPRGFDTDDAAAVRKFLETYWNRNQNMAAEYFDIYSQVKSRGWSVLGLDTPVAEQIEAERAQIPDHYARNRYWADEVVDRLDADKTLRMVILDGEAHNGYAPGDDTVNKEVAARGIDTRVLHFYGEDRVDVSFEQDELRERVATSPQDSFMATVTHPFRIADSMIYLAPNTQPAAPAQEREHAPDRAPQPLHEDPGTQERTPLDATVGAPAEPPPATTPLAPLAPPEDQVSSKPETAANPSDPGGLDELGGFDEFGAVIGGT